jgi:hypothetical protein
MDQDRAAQMECDRDHVDPADQAVLARDPAVSLVGPFYEIRLLMSE